MPPRLKLPQPSGNVHQFDAQSGPRLYSWAKEFGGPAPTPGYFHLDNVKYERPATAISMATKHDGPATITRSTPAERLRKDYGSQGDVDFAVLGAMAEGEAPDSANWKFARGQAVYDNASQPHHQIRLPISGGASMQGPRVLLYGTGPGMAADARFVSPEGFPEFVRRHENTHARHVLTTKHGPYHESSSWLQAPLPVLQDRLKRALLEAGIGDENVADALAGHRIQHRVGVGEMAAFAGHYKDYQYGLTGRLPQTEAEYGDFVKHLLMDKQEVAPMTPDDMLNDPNLGPFGPDPFMGYGAQRGQQAHGHNYLRFMLQNLLIDPQKPDIKRAAQLFKVSDASANRQAGSV